MSVDPPNFPSQLPVHGFVLAGGQSSRMGRDKTLLEFRGRPMVEIAVEKLRSFCADVSIAGNRDDLAAFAPVSHEKRVFAGPTAGIEAGLAAAVQEWAFFIPVDVPLVPAVLLHRWCAVVLEQAHAGAVASFLEVGSERQPAFSMWKSDCLPLVEKTLDAGHRRLNDLLDSVYGIDWGWMWPRNAREFFPRSELSDEQLRLWFSNINTPEELAEAEASSIAGDILE